MSVIVRREVRKRGIFGKIFKFAFYAFNVLMAVFLFLYLKGTSSGMAAAGASDAARVGVGAIGTGMIWIMWIMGDAILGALVLATRGTKVIVEEQVTK